MSSLRDNNKQCNKDTNLSSLEDTINKAIQCLTSTPNMTKIKLLHLQKLLELSKCSNGEKALRKTYAPQAGYVLNMQSSQYVKYKLLELLGNTCAIDTVGELAKDEKLVEFFFCSFHKSIINKNFRLQKALLELLKYILHDIELYQDVSKWKDRMTSLNYDFGSTIITMLLQRTVEVDIFLNILPNLTLLIFLKKSNKASIIDHLFKMDDLIVALIKKFSTTFCVTDRHLPYNTKQFWKIHYWFVLEELGTVIVAIKNMRSFRSNPCYYDIGIRIVHIFTCILRSFIYIVPVTDLIKFYVSNISQSGRQEMTFGPDATFRSITLLLRFFLVHKNLINITEVINDLVDRLEQYLKYKDIITISHFLEARNSLRILDYFEEFHEHFSMIERSCDNMLEEEKWAKHHNLSPNDTYKISFCVNSTHNVERNRKKCFKEAMLMSNIENCYSREQFSKTFNRNTWCNKDKCPANYHRSHE